MLKPDEFDALSYDIVTAGTLVDGVPDDLSALVFHSRPRGDVSVRIYAVGDIGISRRMMNALGDGTLDRLLDPVRTTLSSGQIVFGNYEFPIAGRENENALFASPPGALPVLARTGFTLLNLANNHILDHGHGGLKRTITGVEAAGLTVLGAGSDIDRAQRLVRTDQNGLRIGWLGCAYGKKAGHQDGMATYWGLSPETLLGAVRRARSQVEVLIVSVHMGHMYVNYPNPAQTSLAERLMDAGVDLILMHHAHILQGIEVTSSGQVCCYNLGNFLLDWQEGLFQQAYALREQRESAVFAFDLDAQGIALAAALPIWVDDRYCVRWATRERGRSILNQLTQYSQDLVSGDYRMKYKEQRAARNAPGLMQMLGYHWRHRNWAFLWECLGRARLSHLKMLVRWAFQKTLAKVVS